MDQVVSNFASVKFGSDPELFAERDGRVIGSELAIPEKLIAKYDGAIVRDGVQMELHVSPTHCREAFADSISGIFNRLDAHFQDKHRGKVKMNFEAVIRMRSSQLNQLSAKSRILGCAPSINIYDADAKLGINPETYKIRSAGGHIHLGLASKTLKDEFRRIIRMNDILLGNQAVMMDRNPLMRLRRRVYGRAGECRPQKYGVEYRTLSNFWLRSEPLVSFVLAMARNAVQVIATTDGVTQTREKWNAEKALFDLVDIKDIIKAINTNDFDLAYKNYENIEKFIVKYMPPRSDGLNKTNVKKFRYFVEEVEQKGIESWFPRSPSDYWMRHFNNGTLEGGWENFLSYKVGRKIKK